MIFKTETEAHRGGDHDMVTVYEDDKECRFYFPHFKGRLKFKRIVKAEAEESQVRTFYRLM